MNRSNVGTLKFMKNKFICYHMFVIIKGIISWTPFKTLRSEPCKTDVAIMPKLVDFTELLNSVDSVLYFLSECWNFGFENEEFCFALLSQFFVKNYLH